MEYADSGITIKDFEYISPKNQKSKPHLRGIPPFFIPDKSIKYLYSKYIERDDGKGPIYLLGNKSSKIIVSSLFGPVETRNIGTSSISSSRFK